MRSASIVATKHKAILFAECRNKMGLRAPSLPFEHVDVDGPPPDLGNLLKTVLAASVLVPPKNPGYIDRGKQLLKLAGARSWSRTAICAIIDDDTGLLTIRSLMPKKGGHVGSPLHIVRLPIDSPPDVIGRALLGAIKESRALAGMNDS